MVCQYLCKVSIFMCSKINVFTWFENDEKGIKNKKYLLGSMLIVYYHPIWDKLSFRTQNLLILKLRLIENTFQFPSNFCLQKK